MPSVQLTTILKSVDEKCVSVVKKFKSEVISSALKELDGLIVTCNIPPKNRFLEANKSSPIEWNAFQSLQQSPDQPDTSFREQSFVIKKCTDAIDNYANISHTKLVKNHVIRGYAGCGKSWTMQYCILHAYSRGLFALPTAMMANRAVFLGTKHIDWLFGLPFEKNFSAYKTAESAIATLMKYPERLNILRTLDVLFIDEIGQVLSELLSVIDII